MTFEIFTATQDKLTFLKMLHTKKYPFKHEDQPEAWIQYLIHDNIKAVDIAFCIHNIFGVNMICKELSGCYECNIYILDAISFLIPQTNHDIEKNILCTMHYLIELGAKSGDHM